MYGKALKLLRQYQRLTGVVYADRLGFTRSYVSMAENFNKVSLHFLEACATDFNVKLSSLIAFCESVNDLEAPSIHMCDKMYKVYDWTKEISEFHN